MLIDWFTVGAQTLNFLILVWLLKHFLYKPILNAIDAREKGIASQLADATAKKAEAKKEQETFEAKNKDWDEKRSAVLNQATNDAKVEREHLMGEARKEADLLRAAQAITLRNDQKRLSTQIIHLAQEEVFGITRKALADLATVSLEERMGEVFTRRLREMDEKSKSSLGASLRTELNPAILRSTFPLAPDQKAAIQNALNETFSAEVRVSFETKSDTVCGIELTIDGQKLSWSIADYLNSLDQKVTALVAAQSERPEEPATKSDPKSKSEQTVKTAVPVGAR